MFFFSRLLTKSFSVVKEFFRDLYKSSSWIFTEVLPKVIIFFRIAFGFFPEDFPNDFSKNIFENISKIFLYKFLKTFFRKFFAEFLWEFQKKSSKKPVPWIQKKFLIEFIDKSWSTVLEIIQKKSVEQNKIKLLLEFYVLISEEIIGKHGMNS